ncbi:AAA family ATPase [Moritella sp. 5]|uniref:AAA family ATPase n=1 Tax=Moritella sp. 5 TaxID=2746231 RepID=UPI001BA6A1C6|nr:AAA family ATPase [Moritella sp. 5]QUM81697.1 AAA family ATPase [Moritella sp. 5]
MSETKNEYLNFLESSLSSFSIKEKEIANLIFTNFDAVSSKGVAAGSRGKYVSSLILNTPMKPFTSLRKEDLKNRKKITRLKNLSIKGFRGFTECKDFDLSKQYSFIYGPNGTGKSSICEALEYKLTGKIHEAKSKRFNDNVYTKNIKELDTNVSLVVEYSDGSVSESIASPENEFMFIERNRIEGFARVSSYTNSEKQSRLSLLFGLDEFNKFCTGFSASIKNYLVIAPVKNQELVIERKKIDSSLAIIDNSKAQINGFKFRKNKLMAKYPELDLVSDVIKKLKPDSAFMENLNHKLSKYKKVKIRELSSLSALIEDGNRLSIKYGECISLEKELSQSVNEINFLDLYKAISALEQGATCCPSCDTPLDKVTKNPFDKSKAKLIELENIARTQTSFKRMKSAIDNEIFIFVSRLQKYEIETDLVYSNLPTVIGHINIKLKNVLSKYKEENKENTPLVKEIEELHNQIKNYGFDYTEATTINELFQLSNRSIKQEKSKIDTFDEKNKKLILEASDESKRIDLVGHYVVAYENLIRELRTYSSNLPGIIAGELSNTSMEIYNNINKHPYPHETLIDLRLPKNPSENIMLQFIDGHNEDALRVLSEGHLRCLGLSILLAKSIKDKQNIFIFDDVVNAIDDEHRTGVINELFETTKYKEKQIIVTTHGEDFVKRLENQLPNKHLSKVLKRYDLVRNKNGRDIVILEDQNRQYLEKAKNSLDASKTKDGLMECRRALEDLTDRLWRKLSSEGLSSSVSVKLFAPGRSPDLYSLVDGLIALLNVIEKKPGILSFVPSKNALGAIKDKSKRHQVNWTLLNKGTHEENRDEEFDENLAYELLALLLQLDESIKSYVRPKDLSTIS